MDTSFCCQCRETGDLRGISNRGIPVGLYCRTCFEIGRPAQAFLKWENCMTVAEYKTADAEWYRGVAR